MPADGPERLMMRAAAYADEQMKARGMVPDGADYRVVHAALVSAFFVAYNAGVQDAGTCRGRR